MFTWSVFIIAIIMNDKIRNDKYAYVWSFALIFWGLMVAWKRKVTIRLRTKAWGEECVGRRGEKEEGRRRRLLRKRSKTRLTEENTDYSTFNETGRTWLFISLMAKFDFRIFFLKGSSIKKFFFKLLFVDVGFLACCLLCHKITDSTYFCSFTFMIFWGDPVIVAIKCNGIYPG